MPPPSAHTRSIVFSTRVLIFLRGEWFEPSQQGCRGGLSRTTACCPARSAPPRRGGNPCQARSGSETCERGGMTAAADHTHQVSPALLLPQCIQLRLRGAGRAVAASHDETVQDVVAALVELWHDR